MSANAMIDLQVMDMEFGVKNRLLDDLKIKGVVMREEVKIHLRNLN